MASFVRESKFRHCHVALSPREEHYEQLRVANTASDGNNVACNSQFLAYIDNAAGGAAVAVLPLSSVGKNHIPVLAPTYQQPLIRAHSSPVQDLAFSGLNTQKNRIYTCSSDATLKLWDIPVNGFIVDSGPALSVHSSADSVPFRGIACHTSVENIVATRGTRDVFVFDTSIEASPPMFSIGVDVFGANDLQSFGWSFDGTLLLTSGKDKVLRHFDIRSSTTPVTKLCPHGGNRNSRIIWLGNSPYFLSCGHTATQDREFTVWDSRNTEAVVKRERIDSSTGMIIPIFDPDTNLLILAGKGDTSARLYEFDPSSGAIFAVSNTPLGDVIKGASVLPKQANNLMACEVLRMLKLTDNSIQPVSYTVPRKERLKFHDDLYPPTFWEISPAATTEDWKRGATVILTPQPLATPKAAASSVGSSAPSPVNAPEPATAVSAKSLSGPESPVVSGSRPSSMVFGAVMKYKHMFGTEHPKSGTFYNLKPNTSAMDSPLIACSDMFWAVPYQGGGGPVYVSKLSAFGKVEPTCPVVNGHKAPVLDVSFSPFHSNIMATASDDSTVKIWQLNEDSGVISELTERDACATLNTHSHSVRTCNFHPTVAGLIFTSSLDLTVKLFDINSGSEVGRLDAGLSEGGTVSNLTFNFDGSLAAIATKDRVVKVLDARTGGVCMNTPTGSNAFGRNLRVEWCCTGPSMGAMATVSTASSGMRQLLLWDPRSMTTPICTQSIDNAAGQLFPMYDEGLGVCFLAGKGDTIIRSFEMTFLSEVNSGGSCVKCNEFQSSKSPISGICLLPKRLMDVRNVEVARILKLTTDSVLPISFTVPRADILKAYFQDDIYPPCRSKTPTVSVSDWVEVLRSGETIDLMPTFDSLQPDGVIPLSQKPEGPVRASRAVGFREDIRKSEEESKKKEDAFSKLQGLAVQRSLYHPNASGGGSRPVSAKCDAKPLHDSDDVAEDEWD